MKKMIKTIALCTTLVTMLSACSPQEKTEVVKVQLSVNEQMQADELTDAGEQLIAPHTLHLADRAFALALEKNPNDKKAQFYRAFLKRFMVFRGVATNIKPFVEKYGDIKAFNTQLAKIPNSPIADFLVVPENKVIKRITTAEEAQNLLISYREALKDFRNFITKNQDLKLDLRLSPMLIMSQIQDNAESNCKVVPGTAEEDGQLECSTADIATTRVNVADLMALKQMASAEILYLTIYTSYNLNGVIEANAETQNKMLSAKDSMEHFLAKADLKLLGKNGLKDIRGLGADFGIAMKWAMKYQESICPKDSNGRPKARKGYMFASPICVEDASMAEKNLAMLEQVLAGPMTVNLSEENEPAVTKRVNYMALFDNPVTDLRKLTPATWNDDGTQATSLRDNTLGGLFPDGDADSILKVQK